MAANPGTDGAFADYARSLEMADGGSSLRRLSETVSFQSPYSLWEGREDVSSAFLARSRAFARLVVTDIIPETGDSEIRCLRWTAEAAGETVEGLELVQLDEGLVARIDVFLRPAAVLPGVYSAMVAAWPRQGP